MYWCLSLLFCVVFPWVNKYVFIHLCLEFYVVSGTVNWYVLFEYWTVSLYKYYFSMRYVWGSFCFCIYFHLFDISVHVLLFRTMDYTVNTHRWREISGRPGNLVYWKGILYQLFVSMSGFLYTTQLYPRISHPIYILILSHSKPLGIKHFRMNCSISVSTLSNLLQCDIWSVSLMYFAKYC